MFAELEAGDPRQVGRYRIVARLGAGGMGQVFLGRSPGGRSVAVKVVRAELAQDAGFRRRFAREVAAARRVTGVFTAAVLDADLEGAPAWLATEYVPGMSLGEAVERQGPWPESAVLALGAGLAEALEAIHGAEVVHRDLKPSNVLLASDGPRVIDFGISVTDGVSGLTQTGMVIGTPGFMSPEQLMTGGQVGPASDVFSLGAVLVFAATGAGPFGSATPHALYYRIVHEEPGLSGLPPALGAVAARCLAKEPGQRPTVAALLEELSRHLRDERYEAPGSRSAFGWLPRAVAQALQEQRPAGVAQAGNSVSATDPSAPTRTGRAEERGGPVHPPTALAPPTPATPPVPLTPPGQAIPAASRSRRQVLASVAALGAAGIAFTGWRLVGDSSDNGGAPSRDSSSPGSGGDGSGSRAKSGSERWSLPDFTALSAATVADGTVYVYGFEGKDKDAKGLHALDAANGVRRWIFPLDASMKRSAAADGTVYLADRDGRLLALDAVTGKRRWTFDAVRVTAPAVADGMVYVCGSKGRLIALDATTGKQRWLYQYPRKHVTSALPAPVVADDTVYVGSDDGTLHAVDSATGRKRWTHLSESGSSVLLPAAVADGTVYFSSSSGSLYAVDAAGGKRRWSFRASEYFPSGPVVSDGVVYLHDSADNLYALDGTSGKQRWGFRLGGAAPLDPVVGGGAVCCVTEEGELHAVDARTGRERWSFDAIAESLITSLAIADGAVYLNIADHAQGKHDMVTALVL